MIDASEPRFGTRTELQGHRIRAWLPARSLVPSPAPTPMRPHQIDECFGSTLNPPEDVVSSSQGPPCDEALPGFWVLGNAARLRNRRAYMMQPPRRQMGTG